MFFRHAKSAAILSAFLMVSAACPRADAIEFKAGGEWIVGFAVGDGSLIRKEEGRNVTAEDDRFGAGQRLRLKLDAVASETLSGTVFLEIGDQAWGRAVDEDGVAGQGGALGADGTGVIKLKNAYVDWIAPMANHALRFRMGLQALALPNAAGGSAILDADVAAVAANYQFNDTVGLTVAWIRPLNDNFAGWMYKDDPRRHGVNYLDNMDLLAVSVPLAFDGVTLTPWVMYGMLGKNALDGLDGFYTRNDGRAYIGNVWGTADGTLATTLTSYGANMRIGDGKNLRRTGNDSSSMFWVGLPVSLTLWDPLNIELDINYGYVESIGRYSATDRRTGLDKRADTLRQGWLIKALVEYKFDWGVPGIFGWYASGDDDDVKNGSERMPSLAAAGSFTSFMGYGGIDWAPSGTGFGGWQETYASYAGTWGVGLQLRDVSFLEDLSHTFRVALWGGTNSPSMVKYMNRDGWRHPDSVDGLYLTTNDSMLEFNLDNEYKIYENLTMNLDLGYIVNMVDSSTWSRGFSAADGKCDKTDAWKAQVVFTYSF